MKYLCMIFSDERLLEQMPRAEFDGLISRHLALDDELRDSGHYVSAHALQPTHTATTVRVRDGRTSVTDGPFAETKEHLTGYYLVEARDLNEAIQIAAKIPSARIGCIEVRPVWDRCEDRLSRSTDG